MEHANFNKAPERLTNTNHPAREEGRQGAQGAGRVGGGSARAGKHGCPLGACEPGDDDDHDRGRNRLDGFEGVGIHRSALPVRCSLGGGLLAQHLPRDIGAKLFAGDGASGGALDAGAVLGGDSPPCLPHTWCACGHPNGGGKCGDSARCVEGSFKGGHGANSFAHVCECMALTHVKQPLGVITLVKSFSDRLKESRKVAGLSQAALAQKVGVKPGAVGNWESGEREMPRSIIALAKELNVRPEWLKDGKLPREAGAVAPCADVGEALHLFAVQLQATEDLPTDAIKVLLAMLVDGRGDPGKVHKAVSLIQQLLEVGVTSDLTDSGNDAGRQTSPLQSRTGSART